MSNSRRKRFNSNRTATSPRSNVKAPQKAKKVTTTSDSGNIKSMLDRLSKSTIVNSKKYSNTTAKNVLSKKKRGF